MTTTYKTMGLACTFLAVMVGLSAVATPAYAQDVQRDNGAPSMGLDASKPIDLSATRCEVFENEDTVECTGDVRVTQGPAILTADRMKIFGATAGEGFQRIEGHGDVRYSSEDNAVSGDKAVYDGPANTITVTGDVVVVQGEQVMLGGELIYNTLTRAIVFSPAEDGRVRGLFFTKSAGDAGAVAN
ncbi:MAG: LptA/OstA family protein [Pseudomonadota bacterium]